MTGSPSPPPGRDIRKFRYDDDDVWQTFLTVAKDDNGGSDVLRRFVAWYTRQPGAKLPQRPTIDEVTTT
jgi:hypothetical protein